MGAAGSIESGKEVSAPTGRVGHKERVAELERSPPEAPAFWAEQDLRPHVVISTKFQEPWYSYSQDFKEKADARWLLTFNENLEEVKRTKGFVLQIQQGATHEKSPMQLAEEKQSGWLQVPRIAVFSFDTSSARTLVSGGTLAKENMETALKQAEEQWRNGVEAKLQMCSERYEAVGGGEQAPTDSGGKIHGRAKVTFPDGEVYVGEYQHGDKHGKGTLTWPDGKVYVGEWQHGKMHGKGKHTWPDGEVYVGDYQDGKKHGKGTATYANGNVYIGDFQHGDKHGKGEFAWADGAVYVGDFQHGKMHGKGEYTWADGRVYDGEWEDGNKHGKGTFTYADGNFELGFYVDGNDSGEGVKFTKDRQKAWLLKDGKVVRELSPSEAAKKVQELGLSGLLK